jgi:hypothetical protein
MNESDTNRIVQEVKYAAGKIIEFASKAQVDALLACYEDLPDFMAISNDGKMRDFKEFKSICTDYYTGLMDQKFVTISEKYHVIDSNLVIVGWYGNIIARFKSRKIMKLNNYSITSVFRKSGNAWKVIHDHESSLPPEVNSQV